VKRFARRIVARAAHGIASWRDRLLARGGMRILLLTHFDPHGLGTIRENIAALQHQSRHRYEICNLFKLFPRGAPVQIPDWISLRKYDAVFIHCTLSYNPDRLLLLDKNHREKLGDYRGVIVLMKQDETFRVSGLQSWLTSVPVSLILTCLRPEDVRRIYPTSLCSTTRFFHTLTGYVSSAMRQLARECKGNRPIDIGYRGSFQPFSFGRLCYEKWHIGEVFSRICRENGLRCDISSRAEDRYHGRAWYEFLRRCKATLGVESGASIVDFDGSLEKKCEQYLREHPDADFETVHRLYLAPHENNLRYAQISPRHFEAAACRTLQIMYEGEYSGIFVPGRHYLSLDRNLANIEEVLAAFADERSRQQITETAVEEIVMNDRFSYRTFVQGLDDAIESCFSASNR